MKKVYGAVRNGVISAKNHVVRNKVTYVVGAVAVGAIALQQSNRKAFYAFLEEKGIDPMEYYYPEGFAEKAA